MKRLFAPILLLLALQFPLIAQNTIKVPEKMRFAGMQLTLTEEARDEVQKKVNGLTRSQRFYEDYIERCNIYFPIIQEVFADEKLPEDFKYLALQESALIPDAVSRSNAVGYWQFKEQTAKELGLKVEKNLDERKNIESSSRAAAKYLKKNNYFLKNWIYALLSYNLGLTGANNASDRSKIGSDKLTLDAKTHIYIIHFLAHKIAFEEAVAKSSSMTKLIEYPNAKGQTLDEIAKESGILKEDLSKYNRWFMSPKVPAGYPFYLPVPMKQEKELIAKLDLGKPNNLLTGTLKTTKKTTTKNTNPVLAKASMYPKIKNKKKRTVNGKTVTYATVNNLEGIVTGDQPTSLYDLTTSLDISQKKFMKYNDLSLTDEIEPNTVYYLKKKKSKAQEDFHITQYGQTMQEISQMYGMKKKDLRKKNRMREGEEPQPGRVLWLRKKRSRKTPIEIKTVLPPKKEEKKKVDKDEEKKQANLDNILDIVDGDKKKQDSVDPNVVITDGKFHVVRPGEGLFAIARAYQTTALELAEWNGIDGNSGLKVGQILLVKDPNKIADNNTNVTKKSESLDNILDDVIKIDSDGTKVDSTLNDFVDGKTVIDANGKPVKNGKPRTNQPSSGKLKIHTVRPGDNLYSISRLYDIGHRDLIAWNNVDPLMALKIGETLIVENPLSTPKTTVTFDQIKKHKIARGETLVGIASERGVTVAELVRWNDLDANTVLNLGQELFVEDPVAFNQNLIARAKNNPNVPVNRPKPIYHRVAANEDLQSIAYRYNIGLNELLARNNLTVNSGIVEGQTLLIRDGATENSMGLNDNYGKTPYKPTTTVVVTNNPVVVNRGTQPKYHIVRKGDNLYRMSQAYGVSVAQIKALNNMTSNSLSEGQRVIVGYTSADGTVVNMQPSKIIDSGKTISTYIPDYGTKPSTTEQFHVVKKGDTLYSISKKYGLTVNQLKILNAGITTSLSLNQKVRVK